MRWRAVVVLVVVPPFAFAASDISLVSFDDAGQFGSGPVSQHLANTVAKKPRCLVADTQPILQAHGANAFAAGGDKVDRGKPRIQTEVRSFHRRAISHSKFRFALAAPDVRASRYAFGGIDGAAFRANGSMRPAERFKMRSAGFVGVKAGLEVFQVHA